MEPRDYVKELMKVLNTMDYEKIEKISEVLFTAYRGDKTIYIIGNGGSAATASHFACDLGKGTLGREYSSNLKRFRVQALTDSVELITAYGNDFDYNEIFSQQLRNLLQPGDVLISLTGSGNSENIIRAIDVANNIGAINVGFLGFDGGKAIGKVDHYILVESYNYGVVEDVHLMLEHMICQAFQERIKKE